MFGGSGVGWSGYQLIVVAVRTVQMFKYSNILIGIVRQLSSQLPPSPPTHPSSCRPTRDLSLFQLPFLIRMPRTHLHSLIEEGNFPAAREHIDKDEVSVDDCVLMCTELDERGRTPLAVLAQKAQRHSHFLASVGVSLVYYNEEAFITLNERGENPLEIARGSEACARSSTCSPSLPRMLVRWVVRRCSACTHQCFIGRMRRLCGSNHDRMQTVTSSSMSTMTSWCVKCSNSTILIFSTRLLAIARYTATPSCFLLFE